MERGNYVEEEKDAEEEEEEEEADLPRKNLVAVTSILVSLLKQPVAITFTVFASRHTFWWGGGEGA